MQAADRRMGVPGAAGAMLLENIGQPGGVFGEMLERNRTILHEGDRLAGFLHGHHDVEPLPVRISVDRGLQLGIDHIHDATPMRAAVLPVETVILHQLGEPPQARQVLGLIAFGELDEQDRLGIEAHDRLDDRLEHGDLACQPEHGAVH